MKLINCLRCTRIHPFFHLRSHNYCTYSKQLSIRLKLNYLKQVKIIRTAQANFSTSSCFNDDEKEFNVDDPYSTLTKSLRPHPGTFHNVLVIQPRDLRAKIKSSSKRKREPQEDAERKLDEAVALVQTLRDWKIVEKHIIPTSNIGTKLVFGRGNLETIKGILTQNGSISAIFLCMNIMTAAQNTSLEEYFGVPVFDRYQIILQIFHDHARTKEAKLQLALAEIPYLKIKLEGLNNVRSATNFSGIHHVGGDGETFMERRRRILFDREVKIKRALEKVKKQREALRTTERRSKYPLVAVVGYTNCGKTTLIKVLTKDDRLQPEDKLFATLDVTLHAGRLTSGQQVLFIDTVGFISDVPTDLIQSFKSTLEEITLADLVVHVRDISHPDAELQKQTVLKTLEELKLPKKLHNSILEVCNKVDLLESADDSTDKADDIADHVSDRTESADDSTDSAVDCTGSAEASKAVYISATEGIGLLELQEILEEKLLENTDRSVWLMRVPNGGEEYRWLMKEGTIRDAIMDSKDENCVIVEVILTQANASKFRHRFGDRTVALEDIQ